jgi:spore germination cell wall hydrolase CwlJ-like protein
MGAGRWVAAGAAAVAAGLGVFFLMRKKPGPTDPRSTTPQEVEALARVMQSEAGGEPKAIQVAVGYATINLSNARNVSIWELARGTADEWGGQGSGGRRVSSRVPATAKMTELARAVLSGDEPDPTGGAIQFDSPRAQRALMVKMPELYKTSPEQVAANRRSTGLELVLLPGIPEERFRMWRQA